MKGSDSNSFFLCSPQLQFSFNSEKEIIFERPERRDRNKSNLEGAKTDQKIKGLLDKEYTRGRGCPIFH